MIGDVGVRSTGFVRKVDQLGRVVLPAEMRRILGIKQDSSLEFFVKGDKIVLRKYEPDCIFCGEASEVTYFRGKNVCRICLDSIKE